jgi:hypothetical protein
MTDQWSWAFAAAASGQRGFDLGAWLGALLSGPASNLLSGLIGAIVGVGGLFLIQGLQSQAARKEALSAARLIYIEITYNLAALQSLATATVSVPLLVSSGEWERHSQKLAAVIPEADIVRIALPYIQLNSDRIVFSQKWYYMAVSRMRGIDVDVYKRMYGAFEDAEAALRPAVWTGPHLAGLTQTMASKHAAFAPRRIGQRVRVALSDIPMEFLTLLFVVLLGVRTAIGAAKALRLWFGGKA